MSTITGTGIMTSPNDRQFQMIGKDQQKANSAGQRLLGTMDPYSSNSQKATAGLDSETQIKQYTQEKQSIQNINLRQSKLDDQINRASNINTDFRTYLYSLRSLPSQTSVETIQSQITHFSNAFIATINESYGGAYTLGGDKDQNPCVDTVIAKTPLNVGDPISTDYYIGGDNSGVLSFVGIPVEQFPVAGDHAAFAATLTAIRLMMNPAVTSNPDDPVLVEALRIIEIGVPHYSEAINASANNTRNVQDANERLETLISSSQESLKNSLGSQEYKDISEQMSLTHQIRMQQSLIEGRMDNLKNMLNRMG